MKKIWILWFFRVNEPKEWLLISPQWYPYEQALNDTLIDRLLIIGIPLRPFCISWLKLNFKDSSLRNYNVSIILAPPLFAVNKYHVTGPSSFDGIYDFEIELGIGTIAVKYTRNKIKKMIDQNCSDGIKLIETEWFWLMAGRLISRTIHWIILPDSRISFLEHFKLKCYEHRFFRYEVLRFNPYRPKSKRTRTNASLILAG